MRPSWDDYFLEIAAKVAMRTTCPRAAIGCVIVSAKSHRVLGTGFNGAPANEAHCIDVGCLMLADHCIRATHSEVNAAQQVPTGSRDLVAYVVGGRDVCSHCAAKLYAVGVRRVEQRPAVATLDSLAHEIRTWQAETFPRATNISVAEHLRREAEELAGEPSNPEEMADIFHLLVAAAEANDYDLIDVVATKFVVNKNRRWQAPDHAGVSEHVRKETNDA